MDIFFKPIGVIRSPFKNPMDMPIQPSGAADIKGEAVILKAYETGLTDIEGFSHIMLFYYFHESEGFDLMVKPFLDDRMHGVFATRAPRRPNAIGFSVVELCSRDKNILHIKGLDVLDKTPLLDIKPYVPAFDYKQTSSIGWLTGKTGMAETIKADDRFL